VVKSRSRRAEDILDQAMRLFAERGYAATPVADIQVAAGMTPGSGGLYKHFPSKQSLLEAGIDRFISEGRGATLEVPGVEGVDPRQALRQIGSLVLKVLGQDRSALRVAWRDLSAFPELNRRFVHERLQVGFTQMTKWLTDLARAGNLELEDPQATAAVLLSSLAYFRLMEGLLDATPARLSDDRFLDAWVEVGMSTLGAKASRRRR
jgi:AcrR family transcriptional regulator